MEALFLFGGIFFGSLGLLSLRRAGYTADAWRSWRIIFVVGGILWVVLVIVARDGYAFLRFLDSGYFSVLLGLLGISFIYWHKLLGDIAGRAQVAPVEWALKKSLPVLQGIVTRLHKFIFLFAGIILLLAAFASHFGPIRI